MNFILKLVLFTSFINFSSHGWAASKVTETQVNGYKIYLIDLAQGNQFGYTFAVPYGSANDSGKLFGRAHFYEHMFARGSKKYPGHETLIQAMSTFGYGRNAATGLSQTYYFASGHESRGIEAMTMHMASLDEPELEASSLQREKATVINEVVTSRPNQPSRALYAMPFSILLQDGHPLKGNHVGDLGTLEPMSADDLRQLHHQIYRPENVSVAVFANFSSGTLTREKVLSELEGILPKDKKPTAAYKPTATPPLFDDLKARVIDAQSSKEQLGAVFFELPNNVNLHAVEALLEVIASPHRNGLLDKLKREKGWIDNLSASTTRAGSKNLVFISFRLTQDGFAVRDQVLEILVNSLRTLQTEKVPEDVLEAIQNSQLKQLRELETNLPLLLQVYANWMTSGQNKSELLFDWQKSVHPLSVENVLLGARSVNLSAKVAMFIGPVEQRPTDFEPIYKLNYSTRPWPVTISQDVQFQPGQMAVTKIDLGATPTGKLNGEYTWHAANYLTTLLTYQPDWKDRSLQIEWTFGALTPVEELSLVTWMRTLRHELSPELAVLESQGISLELMAGDGTLSIRARGRTGREALAIYWLSRQLKSLSLTAQKIELHKKAILLGLQRSENGFPGSVVHSVVNEVLNPRGYSTPLFIGELPKVDASSITAFREGPLLESEKLMAIAGEFRNTELEILENSLNVLSPRPPPIEVKDQFARITLQPNQKLFEAWMNPELAGVGIAQVFAGPSGVSPQERAAMLIARTLLHEQVFLRNRPLGYVQGVAPTANLHRDHYIVFYGQTKTSAEIPALTAVWQDEINKWLNQSIPLDKIEATRKGLVARFSKSSDSSEAGLDEVLNDYKSFGSPFFNKKILAALEAVTSEEVFAVVKKYLSSTNASLIITKGPGEYNCDEVLLTRKGLALQ